MNKSEGVKGVLTSLQRLLPHEGDDVTREEGVSAG